MFGQLQLLSPLISVVCIGDQLKTQVNNTEKREGGPNVNE